MPKYIIKAIGKVASTAAAATLGFLGYAARPADAQEPKRPEKTAPIEILVKSYSAAQAGEERNRQITELITAAYQDPTLSPEDRNYIADNLAKKVSDAKQRTQIAEAAKNYVAVQAELLKARAAYDQEVIKAGRITGDKDKIAALARAEQELYIALAQLEQKMPGTQYAQEMLEIAKKGLEHAKRNPATLLEGDFKEFLKKSQAAAEQSKKEAHLLSELVSYGTAVDVALEHAQASKEPEQKIRHYKDAIDLLNEAEQLFPYDQFPTHVNAIEKKIAELSKAPEPEKPKEPEMPKESDKPKEPEASKEPEKEPEKKPEEPEKTPPDDKTHSAPGDADQDPAGKERTTLAQFLQNQAGSRYDSMTELRGGLLSGDREGHIESLYARIGKAAEAAILNSHKTGLNAAGNKTKDNLTSAYLEMAPASMIASLFGGKSDPECLKAGMSVEFQENKEWVFLDDELVDTNPNYTETKDSNIRNYIKRKFTSFWADSKIKDAVKLRISAMLDATSLITEENFLTWHEDHIDPNASYPEAGRSRTGDQYSKKGMSGIMGIPLEFLSDGAIKGYLGISMDYILEESEFTGSPRTKDIILKPGVRAELFAGDTFGIAAAFLQDITKEDGEETAKTKTYRGQIAAALDLGNVQDERGNSLFTAMLFGNGWLTGYGGDSKYGGGGGILLGSKVIKDVSGLVQLLYNRDSRKTGSRIELSDEMQAFLERRGLIDIPAGVIGGKEKYGFALLFYGSAGKAQGIGGRTKTETFAELAAITDTPWFALMVSGHYSDLALEREWGVRLRADIKRGLLRGFAGAIEVIQRRHLPTDDLETEIAAGFEVPLGSDEKKDEQK